MGEPACLHIQDRAWGPIRVVEIPWISVRVGRSARCEVRLSDPSLPREVCQLERRSGEWRITPLGRECVIELGDRSVQCTSPLPFDVPFRVGSYVFTLRRDRASQPDWAMHEMRIPPVVAGSRGEFARVSFTTPEPPTAPTKPPAASSPSWVRETDRWANRWRQAGASLEKRERSYRSSRPQEPLAKDVSRPSTEPLDETPGRVDEPLEAQPMTTPSVEPPSAETQALAGRDADSPVLESLTSESLRLLETPFLIDAPETVANEPVIVSTMTEPMALEPEPSEPKPSEPVAVQPEPEAPGPREPEDLEPEAVALELPAVEAEAAVVLAPVELENSRTPDQGAGLPGRDGVCQSDREWPRASEVLASYQHRAVPAARSNRSTVAKRPIPTIPREPETWGAPIWLASPVIVGLLLLLGVVGGGLSFEWAIDSGAAALTASRLFAPPARWRPLPIEANPPGTRWFQTTGRHLAHHALATTGDDQPIDETRTALRQALAVAPIEPESRLALVRLPSPEKGAGVSASDLGLVRDSLALASSARRLAEVGDKERALALYREALLMADRPGLGVQGVPGFSEDPAAERFLLPGEERIRAILTEITAEPSWKPEDWLSILPKGSLVELAAARLLMERGSEVGRPILERLAGEQADGRASMLDHAIQGESLALLSRWDLADRAYRRAIEAAPEGVVKRALWFNLADVGSRLDDEGRRQSALKAAALAVRGDDVTRRATLARRGSMIERARAETSPRAN